MTFRLKHPLLASALSTSLLLLPAISSAGNLGIAAKASTLGLGLEADYIISDTLSVRVQVNQYDYDDTFDEDGIEYEGALELSSVGALVDWHPFGGGFRISAGGFNVDNEISGVGSGVGTYQIGDEEYTVDVGDTLQVTSTMTLGDGFKPYLGIGWGHSPANTGGLLLSFDVGILFQGSPEVDLDARGTAEDPFGNPVDFSTDPTVQAEVRKEERNLEDDLKEFDLYPVVSIGIGWRF